MIGREPVSGLTHLIGAVLAAVGLVWLIMLTVHDTVALIAASVYGVCMVAMFTSSTILHLYDGPPAWIRFFNKLDHMAIHLMIAGSYTIFCTLALDGIWQWGLITAAWVMTIGGIIDKAMNFKDRSVFSMVFYFASGWLAVIAAPELVVNVPPDSLRLIVAGGMIFTAGTLVYIFDDPKVRPFFGPHEVWHLFVLAGAASHFAAVVALL